MKKTWNAPQVEKLSIRETAAGDCESKEVDGHIWCWWPTYGSKKKGK